MKKTSEKETYENEALLYIGLYSIGLVGDFVEENSQSSARTNYPSDSSSGLEHLLTNLQVSIGTAITAIRTRSGTSGVGLLNKNV